MRTYTPLILLLLLFACKEDQTSEDKWSTEFSVGIKQPIEVVFDYASDPENLTEWGDGILDVNVTTPGSLRVGTTYVIQNKVGGRIQEFTSEVIALVPNQKYAFKTGGIFPYHSTRRFTTEKGLTVITERLVAEKPSGFKRLTAPMIMKFARKSHHQSLQNLKTILEEKL